MNPMMRELGARRSVIRELFEYGTRRKQEIGAENVFDFSLGNPSVPAPEAVRAELVRLLNETPAVELHGYTTAAGDPGVRRAIADYLNRTYGAGVDAKYMYLTVGAAASLTISLTAILNPGDDVVLLAPYFPEYRVFVERTGARALPVLCDPGSFQPDFAALEQAISPTVRAVIVNSPNNPTGAVLTEESIRRLSALLERKQEQYGLPIYLISDEPYRELVYGDVTVPYLTRYYDNTLVCYSFSKSLSLPGERIGYVAAGPDCAEAETIIEICGQISRGIGHNCPPSIIQLAVARCLAVTSDLRVYRTNRDILYKELTDLGFTCVEPGGTFYIFPKALEEDSVAFCKKALDYDLVLVPADSFGCPGYFRMAYCIETEKVERSLPVLRRFAKEVYGK